MSQQNIRRMAKGSIRRMAKGSIPRMERQPTVFRRRMIHPPNGTFGRPPDDAVGGEASADDAIRRQKSADGHPVDFHPPDEARYPGDDIPPAISAHFFPKVDPIRRIEFHHAILGG
jgi:hypothetical protein